jgi:hypothetical protein
VEGSCEHGIETSGTIKCWEVLEGLHNWRLLKQVSGPYGMVSTGAGFPMHLDLYLVHCASPIEFQFSRHTLSVPALCTAYLPKNSGTQL